MLDSAIQVGGAIVDTCQRLCDSSLTLDTMQVVAEATPISHHMMVLVLQIGILIFAAYLGGKVAMWFRLPGVLGELCSGIVVGPYLLGKIPLGSILPHGIFGLDAASSFAVSPELYGFATISSIILLFMTGLETDLGMFIRYSVAGMVVGIGGVIFSLAGGMMMGPLFFGVGFTSPLSLFLGVLCTATSVGITARILSEKRKIDSSEGVTILAGAVIDDVLGIICLAVVMGISAASRSGAEGLSWQSISWISAKAILTWLIFTALGLIFAYRISKFLKRFFRPGVIMTAALGFAFVLAAIFEISGLAMIIGAYVMGLTLSKTDLKFMLMEKIHGLYLLFVPVFFAVMGALVDVTQFLNPNVLKMGLIYAALAFIAKIIGCGLPSFLLKFNWKGALRIGVGMAPRGEVALIIAGLGVAEGILDSEMFGVAILMTLLTTVVAPPILSKLLDMPGRGTVSEDAEDDTVTTIFDLQHPVITGMVVEKLCNNFSQEGFFISRMELEESMYQMRKDNVAFSMTVNPDNLCFSSAPKQVYFIKMAVYETLIEFQHSIDVLKNFNRPEELRQRMANAVLESSEGALVDMNPIVQAIRTDCIRLTLYNSKSKDAVIRELVDVLGDAGVISDRDTLYNDVLEREKQISTGLQDGIAIPHTKSDEVSHPHLAIGICHQGMDFDSLDGKPTRLIILLVSPKQQTSAHLQILASLGSMSLTKGFLERVVNAQTFLEIKNLFTQAS